MDCKQLIVLLEDYLDGQLGEVEAADCSNHIQGCNVCRDRVRGAQRLRSMLRTLPRTGPRFGFVAQSLAAARAAHRDGRRLSFTGAIGMALSLGLVAVVLMHEWPAQHTDTRETTLASKAGASEQTNMQFVNVSMLEHRNVRLVFDVPRDLDQVKLKIELPDNVVLAKSKSTRQLLWQTNLSKGSNVLTLPIQAVGYGEGVLSTVLIHNGGQKTFRLRLVTDPDSTMIEKPTNVLTI